MFDSKTKLGDRYFGCLIQNCLQHMDLYVPLKCRREVHLRLMATLLHKVDNIEMLNTMFSLIQDELESLAEDKAYNAFQVLIESNPDNITDSNRSIVCYFQERNH